MPELFGTDAYSPREVARKVEEVGVAKVRLPLRSTFMLGVLAGGFIGLGGLYYTLITSDPSLGYTQSRLLGGLGFSMGYIVAIVAGAEVFTSNNLQAMSFVAGKLTFFEIARHWIIVLLANAVGAIGLVVIVLFSGSLEVNEGAMARRALEIAAARSNLTFIEAFSRGVLGNTLVCLAVWMSLAGRSVTDKMLAMVLPLSAVAALSLEHVTASLYYIPRGLLLRAYSPHVIVPGMEHVTFSGFISNVIPVTLGNIVGGSVLVALAYYFIYRWHAPASTDTNSPPPA